MKRIYDAAWAATNGTHPSHLGTFWWVDGNQTGTWTREQAHDYVAANPRTVYVAEGYAKVIVVAYHHTNNPNSRWIQTEPDETKQDNLITLANRHAQGLPNR